MVRESFALKSGVDNFAGGSIAYGPDGKSIDLSPLVVPDAIITVQSEMQASALRELESLKSVSTPDEHEHTIGDGDEAILSTVSLEDAAAEQKRLFKEGPASSEEDEAAPQSGGSPSGSSQGAPSGQSGASSGVTTPPVQPAPTGASGPGKTGTGGER